MKFKYSFPKLQGPHCVEQNFRLALRIETWRRFTCSYFVTERTAKVGTANVQHQRFQHFLFHIGYGDENSWKRFCILIMLTFNFWIKCFSHNFKVIWLRFHYYITWNLLTEWKKDTKIQAMSQRILQIFVEIKVHTNVYGFQLIYNK
jgi:hypothetical protein